MNQGPSRQGTLWSIIFPLSFQSDAKAVHQWLQTNLPFWAENKTFDHMAFVAWYDRTSFMDREIVYKYLTKAEQTQVLKAWANAITPPCITIRYQQSTPVVANNETFLDNAPPVRVRDSKQFTQ